MKKIFLSFLLLLASAIVFAQEESNIVENEIMVQLNDNDELSDIIKSHNLEVLDIVSERFNIYLLGIMDNKRSNTDVIAELKRVKAVINVQNNHYVTLRETQQNIPDDSLFNKQWSLLNTGQGSGYAGADIDATLAWDITTGGLTAHGDTIVVAVVDGGSDLDHEDLNHWKNHAEIPNNGIDDDNNGYVDDYDGWNAYNNSGNIPDNNHGVHVSGIIGAIGNNDVGVAGVNWNVKVLPVAGESSYEAIVVKALSYLYVVREQYDQSNGAEGAFIVAQNNSFGVDKGQPAQYPIWEAMYDSLGSLGILSMGATANRAWDIDSVGDVPTAFETPYMIAVTNTTNKDLLNGGAAWGDTTIDLGSPGSAIWSLGVNGTYRTSSGTSMATPHVAGAAALLMAAADSSFIADYKNNPGESALLIKDYILNGVDPLDDLQGKTVTGGRLNLFNSLNLMVNKPVLSLNPGELLEEIPLNYSSERNVLISNIGSDTLEYNISIIDQPQWITLSINQGLLPEGLTDTLIVTFSSATIDTGHYSCNLVFSGPDIDTVYLPVSLYVYDETGIDELSNEDVSIFPIPASEYLSFEIQPKTAGNYKIIIFDATGKVVHSFYKKFDSGKINHTWECKKYSSGYYFYSISRDDRVIYSGKLTKR